MNSSPTQTAVVYSDLEDSAAAGQSLGQQITKGLGGLKPHALVLFVSPKYDAPALLAAVSSSCEPELIVGCSSAGEFTNDTQGEGLACAIAFHSTEMKFAAGLGHGISKDRVAAAQAIVKNFHGAESVSHSYSSALVLTDALAGHADELIEQLTISTGGNYQFFGGGAGDDANFRRTQVICGSEVASDAAVALEILSEKPIGVGVRHGWHPVSDPMRVTESRGPVLVSLDATRAVDVLEDHAAATGQKFDRADPVPFFLHNILGIDTGQGFQLRVPLALGEDGSIHCAAEIPTGATLCIMGTNSDASASAAAEATRDALRQLNGHQPRVALFFDCVATRLRLGKDFGFELSALKEVLGTTQFAGCNTYGQVARADGQFNGFHNCTAVVCVLP